MLAPILLDVRAGCDVQSECVCAVVVETKPAMIAAAEMAKDFMFAIIVCASVYRRSVVSRVDQTR